MNKNLKLVLKNRSDDQGFALPIAIGMGLIMILVSTTMVMRSQGDQTTASTQKATNRGLSAAETGITRYQSLINDTRIIAMYPRVGTPGWTTASSIPKICGTAASDVTAKATTDWRDVDSSDVSKGQYKLVNYVYPAPGTTGTVGTTPGTGQLTVEGRVNQSGNGNTASTTATTATTRLVVKVPVVNQRVTSAVPGLWIKNVVQSVGSNKVQGNILVDACSIPTGVSTANLQSSTNFKVIADTEIPFPDTPGAPTSNLNMISSTNMDSRIWGQTLPLTNDLAQPDGSFHYLIQGDLTQTGTLDITLFSNSTVIFYVQGNINTGANATINGTRYPQNMQIYGNTFQRNTDGTIALDALTSRPLTKYGCSTTLPTISSGLTEPPAGYTTACRTTLLTANVTTNSKIRALIHAPDATGSIIGTGGTTCGTSAIPFTGNVFIGAVWIKKWDAGSASSNPMVCAYGNYLDYIATRQVFQPSIPSITSWERQEAD